MKRLKDIAEILNNLSKFPAESSEILSQREKMEETFSPSHDIVEYMSSYWKWGKFLGEQDFSGEVTWRTRL